MEIRTPKKHKKLTKKKIKQIKRTSTLGLSLLVIGAFAVIAVLLGTGKIEN